MTPEEIAAELVANGYARRLPRTVTACWETLELEATPDGWGKLFVSKDGEILVGHSLRRSRPVSARFRRMAIGEIL